MKWGFRSEGSWIQARCLDSNKGNRSLWSLLEIAYQESLRDVQLGRQKDVFLRLSLSEYTLRALEIVPNNFNLTDSTGYPSFWSNSTGPNTSLLKRHAAEPLQGGRTTAEHTFRVKTVSRTSLVTSRVLPNIPPI